MIITSINSPIGFDSLRINVITVSNNPSFHEYNVSLIMYQFFVFFSNFAFVGHKVRVGNVVITEHYKIYCVFISVQNNIQICF